MRRPNVPENLKPQIATRAEELSRRGNARERPEPEPTPKPKPPAPELEGRQGANGKQPQRSNSAVALQVLEGRQVTATSNAVPANASIEPPKVEDLQPKPQDIKLSGELSDEDKAYVRQLKSRDREVRAHEAAHATAGSGYTSQPNFEYVRGPDGVQYAVGGHVSIDTSAVPDDPEATIAKMEVVRQAALAPARPSGQDRAVAAAAEQSLRAAQAELQEQRTAEQQEQGESAGGADAAVASPFELADQSEAEAALAPDAPVFGVGAPRPAVQQPVSISIDLIA
ncbi:SprA-related family protein [Kordiimonas lacus]|uniref:SprA-related family protein n=2 Tax=Kordiimonas lacus TaxID=637679 RepID=A0A1G6TRA3_9PROT|nr:SprA-related family protein [Kordiimonas lacus]